MKSLEIHIIDTRDFSLEKLLTLSSLDDKHLKNIEKFQVEKVKKEQIASNFFKQKYIKKIDKNEYGKPISDECYFNISHSNGVVVFVKDNDPIGIDIEVCREVEDDLKRYISTDEEYKYMKDSKNFFEIWTNKEALIKNIGTGIMGKISDIPGLPINGVRNYKGNNYNSLTLHQNDYVITVCVLGKEKIETRLIKEAVFYE